MCSLKPNTIEYEISNSPNLIFGCVSTVRPPRTLRAVLALAPTYAGTAASMSALTARPTSLERRWQLSFERLRPLLQQPCEAAASASLHSLAHESSDGEHEVAQALLYGLLTQPHVAALLFRLMCCLRDVELAVSELVQLVLWRYAPLLQPAKQQVLWLLSQLVRSRVAGTHRLALALLRQVGAADCSPSNLWLADNLGSFFAHHADWLLLEPEGSGTGGSQTDGTSDGRAAALLQPLPLP